MISVWMFHGGDMSASDESVGGISGRAVDVGESYCHNSSKPLNQATTHSAIHPYH
jgi:hypothetical protein